MRFGCFLLLPAFLAAQSTPVLSVDATAGVHPISPDIYGINDYQNQALGTLMRLPVVRNGGDGTNRYNWKIDTLNSAADYFFENYVRSSAPNPPDGSSFDSYVERGLTTAAKRIGTISLLGWLPKSNVKNCSFSVAKYGAQQKVDPYHMDCGNGIKPDGKTQIVNDPTDTSAPFDASYQIDWIKYLVSKYGSASRGGVNIWSLDNEPEWWSSVHIDVHPVASTYDEILNSGITYASAVKQADPTALVTGYVPGGWSGMFYSRTDFNSGWSTSPYQFWDNPVDRNAHGGTPLVEWYLQNMAAYEAQHGARLLDYVDVHAYIAPSSVSNNQTDAAADQLRMTSTRVLWDPNYVTPDNTTPDQEHPAGDPPQLIPRMKKWVADDYPGTKTAITEYNWGALNEISGAIAQADILGIFGREGLDLATLWGPPDPTKNPPDAAVFAFQIFLNYDGAGNQFGETSVAAATDNPDNVSIFAATRSDRALTILVLNKMTSDVTTPISLAHFQPSTAARVYQFTAANPAGIQHLPDIAVAGNAVSAKFPALSMTLLVVPAAPDSLPVPKPVVAGVAGAASYNAQSITPGEILYIAGQNFGPAALTTAQVTPDGGYLTQSLAGVRVLINGIPCPMIYQSGGAVSAVVPYYVGLGATAAVQVEVQGVRSDPFQAIPIASAVPALFTHDESGSGQGAILNEDLTLNSAANPATQGHVVVLYGTGEGQTSPPGVDGRLAVDIRPIPSGACAVNIGGQPAQVQYCGAAPNYTSGLLQVNAVVPAGISSGDVPVTLTIGSVTSSAKVTLAVK